MAGYAQARRREVRREAHRLAAAAIRQYLERPSDDDPDDDVDAELWQIVHRHEVLGDPPAS